MTRTSREYCVGVLALQGDFDKHAQAVTALGAVSKLVKYPHELENLDAIILPGGESSTMLKLLNQEFRAALVEKISKGLPTLATCAGAILVAKRVHNPNQESLGLARITISRNDYGRQIDSFISPEIKLSDSCSKLISGNLEGIFIRAPRITECDPEVEILATHDNDPVLVKQDKLIVATFHPELEQGHSAIHRLLLEQIT